MRVLLEVLWYVIYPYSPGLLHGRAIVYPKKYAHGFVVLCFVVVMQSFIMNSVEVFIHIHQGCFAGTWAIVRLPQCQWSKPDGYVKISQCITTTKHSKAKTVCIFLGIYCMRSLLWGFNTLRPRQNGRHFADDIFKWIFLNENVWIPIKISLKFVPRRPINNIPAFVQIMAWRRPGDKPLSGPMMVILPTHICVTRPQWVKRKRIEL